MSKLVREDYKNITKDNSIYLYMRYNDSLNYLKDNYYNSAVYYSDLLFGDIPCNDNIAAKTKYNRKNSNKYLRETENIISDLGNYIINNRTIDDIINFINNVEDIKEKQAELFSSYNIENLYTENLR